MNFTIRATLLCAALGICLCGGELSAQSSAGAPGAFPDRVTILYDAFTGKTQVTPDWGYAALVEFEGKRILFDTGNDAAIFQANVTQLKVDLTRLDLVVLSHRHGDHTSGLRYLLSVNPSVQVYAPRDEPFQTTTPPTFFKNKDAGLSSKMQYFGGHVPTPPPGHGTAWPGVLFHTVEGHQDVTPHIHLVSTLSETPGFRDMPELSLVLDTPRGPIVIVGCSHPGIENILASVTKQTGAPRIYEVIGGMHLLLATPDQLNHTFSEVFDRYHVQRMAPGHCTGEQVFALLQQRLGNEYVYAGLGEVLPLQTTN